MMEKATRIWLIIAAATLLLGSIVFCAAMAAANWDFQALSTDKYITSEHTVTEGYQNISIVTDTADVEFLPSDSSHSFVSCYELENMKHSVSVENGTLVISLTDTRHWYDHIGIHFGTPKIHVALPKGSYGSITLLSATGDVKIPEDFSFESTQIVVSTGDITSRASSNTMELITSTGDIRLEDVTAETLSLSVSAGDTELENIQCRVLNSRGNTGEISMERVIVTQSLSIERTTGDVEFSDCDAPEIFIKTDTGDVDGSLRSEKIFTVHTDTGDIAVPQTASGGKCEIRTTTGDVEITIE